MFLSSEKNHDELHLESNQPTSELSFLHLGCVDYSEKFLSQTYCSYGRSQVLSFSDLVESLDSSVGPGRMPLLPRSHIRPICVYWTIVLYRRVVHWLNDSYERVRAARSRCALDTRDASLSCLQGESWDFCGTVQPRGRLALADTNRRHPYKQSIHPSQGHSGDSVFHRESVYLLAESRSH